MKGSPTIKTLVDACKRADMWQIREILTENVVNPQPALDWAVASGSLAIVSMFLEDPRVDPTYNRNSALYVSIYYKYPEMTRTLLMEPRVFAVLDYIELLAVVSQKKQYWLLYVIRETEAIPETTLFNFAIENDDPRMLRVLLDMPRVTVELYHVCECTCRGKEALFQEFFKTPWLDFSPRVLSHLQTSQTEKYIRSHPRYKGEYAWEYGGDECNCLHQEVARFSRANPQSLAIAWCMSNITGWQDMIEPTIDRFEYTVTLCMDDEGPIFGIERLPAQPPFFWGRLFFGLLPMFGVSMIMIFRSPSRTFGDCVVLVFGGVLLSCYTGYAAIFDPNFGRRR